MFVCDAIPANATSTLQECMKPQNIPSYMTPATCSTNLISASAGSSKSTIFSALRLALKSANSRAAKCLSKVACELSVPRKCPFH